MIRESSRSRAGPGRKKMPRLREKRNKRLRYFKEGGAGAPPFFLIRRSTERDFQAELRPAPGIRKIAAVPIDLVENIEDIEENAEMRGGRDLKALGDADVED